MATRALAATYKPNGNSNCLLIQWTGLLNGDDGGPYENMDYADQAVQVDGTFGAGGSITFQGSVDGTSWFPTTDPQGNAITKTAAALEQVMEVPRYIRPLVTAGDGTTSLSCRLWLRRSR